MKKLNGKTLILVAASFLVLIGGYFVLNKTVNQSSKPVAVTNPTASQAAIAEADASPTLAGQSTEQQLLYLIEEEKLAHDVYTVMYQQYGANVFGNILESESTHQGMVLTLLSARNIPDPRSSEVGVFKNQALQAFYNQLIEQGNKNATEAYKAGVAIEERDIADISTQLSTTSDQDVVATLESLRSGSENHLRAFNRQL